MDEKLKTVNIKSAIAKLPNPKSYPPNMVTVLVGKLKYIFEKTNDEWFLTL